MTKTDLASAPRPRRRRLRLQPPQHRRHLRQATEVEVVGKAGDGEEALRLATTLRPDVITLDLEMPRMDGFTFLRILMSRSRRR